MDSFYGLRRLLCAVVNIAVLCSQMAPLSARIQDMSQSFNQKRSDLRDSRSWNIEAVKLISSPSASATSERALRIESKNANLELSEPPYYAPLTVLTEPRSGYTFVVFGGQDYYLADHSDLLAFTIDGGAFFGAWSFFTAKSRSIGIDATISRFLSEVDDATLAKKVLGRQRIDMRHGAPFPFFTAGSTGSSQPGKQTITALDLTDDTMRLDLVSDGGKYKGTFWIDLKGGLLQRSVVDGKEFFKAK